MMIESKMVTIQSETGIVTTTKRQIPGKNGKHGFIVYEDPGVQEIIDSYLKEGWSIACGDVRDGFSIRLLLARKTF